MHVCHEKTIYSYEKTHPPGFNSVPSTKKAIQRPAYWAVLPPVVSYSILRKSHRLERHKAPNVASTPIHNIFPQKIFEKQDLEMWGVSGHPSNRGIDFMRRPPGSYIRAEDVGRVTKPQSARNRLFDSVWTANYGGCGQNAELRARWQKALEKFYHGICLRGIEMTGVKSEPNRSPHSQSSALHTESGVIAYWCFQQHNHIISWIETKPITG